MRFFPSCLAAALLLSSCKFSVNPNTAKFNCATNADCGSGSVEG